jgi:hypothetical protein
MSKIHAISIRLLVNVGLIAFGLAQAEVPVPAKSSGAAVLYEAVAKDLARTFQLPEGDVLLSLPDLGGDGAHAWRFAGEEWAPIVTKAAGELAVFAQAARMPKCEFGPGLDPSFSRYEELHIPLWQLSLMTAAHGWQCREKEPGSAVQDAVTLLRHARQVAPCSGTSALLAGMGEVVGLALMQDVLANSSTLSDAQRDTCRRELALHKKERGGLPGVAQAIRTEVRTVTATLIHSKSETPDAADAADAAEDAGEKLLRERGKDVMDQLDAVVVRRLRLLEGDPARSCVDVLAEVRTMEEAARKVGPRDLKQRLPSMTVNAAIDAMADLLATMMIPGLSPIVESDFKARELMKECEDDLAKAGESQPVGK